MFALCLDDFPVLEIVYDFFVCFLLGLYWVRVFFIFVTVRVISISLFAVTRVSGFRNPVILSCFVVFIFVILVWFFVLVFLLLAFSRVRVFCVFVFMLVDLLCASVST